MDKVDECPYCGGTYPHQAPTGCRELPEIADTLAPVWAEAFGSYDVDR